MAEREMNEQERDALVASVHVEIVDIERRSGSPLTVQTETPPDRYVMARGPVTIDVDRLDDVAMANWSEQWITCDVGRMQG